MKNLEENYTRQHNSLLKLTSTVDFLTPISTDRGRYKNRYNRKRRPSTNTSSSSTSSLPSSSSSSDRTHYQRSKRKYAKDYNEKNSAQPNHPDNPADPTNTSTAQAGAAKNISADPAKTPDNNVPDAVNNPPDRDFPLMETLTLK